MKELESKKMDWINQAKNATFLEEKACTEREGKGDSPSCLHLLNLFFFLLEEGVYV